MTIKFQEIIVWFHNDKDYQAGLLLLAKYGKNAVLLRNLMKPGKEKFGGHRKLTFQLAKIAGFNALQPPELPEELKNKTVIKIISPTVPEANLISTTTYKNPKFEDENQYPKIIRRILHEYRDWYTKRSITYKKMADVEQTNSPSNMEARAAFLDEINTITERMDFIYKFIIAYQTNQTIPEENKVWQPVHDKNKLPDDIDSLRKMKKNMQSANSKDRNFLLYQNDTKQKKEIPLPEGPKKKELILRIKKRERIVIRIDVKLLKLKYAD